MQDLIEQIKQKNVKKVMLQLPAGLKTKSIEIAKELEKNEIDAVIANNPCYGACDLADKEAEQMNCDLLVHIGHSKFYVDFKTAVPILYYIWPMKINISIDASAIKEERIGLLTTIQHLEILSKAKEQLEQQGKKAEIGGQVLGCWTVNADKIANKVDAFLYIGSGKFHPLAVRNKKIYSLDIERNEISEVDVDKEEKIKYANIFSAKDAKTFAILVTTKAGQNQLLGKAEEIKKKIEENQRSAFIVIMNEITDQNLQGIKADAFINTACPRILEDRFSKPMINANDLEKVFE